MSGSDEERSATGSLIPCSFGRVRASARTGTGLQERGFSPRGRGMRPSRNHARSRESSYFISTQTHRRQPFFRHERWARLMLEVLRSYDSVGYRLHAFVVMPDHLYVLLTPEESLEKSVQLMKGGFSFRAKRELAWKGEIWQPGFTDHRIRDHEEWMHHIEYIRRNPAKARLVKDLEPYAWMEFPAPDIPQELKPLEAEGANVRAEARTLLSGAGVLKHEPRTAQSEAHLNPMTSTTVSERSRIEGESNSRASFKQSRVTTLPIAKKCQA